MPSKETVPRHHHDAYDDLSQLGRHIETLEVPLILGAVGPAWLGPLNLAQATEQFPCACCAYIIRLACGNGRSPESFFSKWLREMNCHSQPEQVARKGSLHTQFAC
ncbi:hypothetical protein PMIN06_012877 [Paraphaeosphaeria minitans]